MGVSTFHHHFRRLTAISTLQCQKWLRLNEAERLMLDDDLDAARAVFRVGYKNPSQFIRKYSRLFGTSPRRDIVGMRREAGAPDSNARS
jgi:AraC-like DNA-binding protein